MTLPKEVVILGEVYKVKRIKGLIERENCEGYASAHEYLIGIDASLKGRILQRVYYHELAHCFAFESGLHEVLPLSSIEMFCQNLSGFMLNF